MKIEGYEVEEVEPGVKVYSRVNASHTTFEESAPWIHFHYQKTDDEAEALGSTEVELCCHGCGVALWVTMPFPPSEALIEKAKALREQFRLDHVSHDTVYGDQGIAEALGQSLGRHPMSMLCPISRKQLYAVTLTD